MELIDRDCQKTSAFVVYRSASKVRPNGARRFFSRVTAFFAPRLIEYRREDRTYLDEIEEKRALFRAEHNKRFF